MDIELNINEINSIEKIIKNIFIENDFNKINKVKSANKVQISTKFLFPNIENAEDIEFISLQKSSLKPVIQLLSEQEFYKITGVTKKGLSKKSGKYQEYLYGHYLEAIKLQDAGYIADIYNKTIEFQTNINYIKILMKNKAFAQEWRNNFKEETAIEVYKRKGNMRIIDIIKERTNKKI